MPYSPKTSPKFNRIAKKFPEELKIVLDDQIRAIIADPLLGEAKTGDLAGVRVHKFGYYGRLYLIAYEVDDENAQILIYAVGGHENFYRDLKQYLKS
jgi:mRNA interferase RelE/StbE